MCYSKFAGGHALARRNGYKGAYAEYVKLQYNAYRTICKRCEIKPLAQAEWMQQ